MTNFAQNLNVVGIGSKVRFCAMGLYVVPLKIVCGAALFAKTSFLDKFSDYFSNRVASFACAAFPVKMILSPHFFTARFCQTWDGAVIASSSTSFSKLKRNATFFANVVKHSFWALLFNFVRARNRTSVCVPSYMCMMPCKLNTTSCACKFNAPSSLNFSLEFCHG